MKITIFVGDLCDASTEALCTSTNPRLSLAMGTGGSVRERGGIEILRACEAIIEAEFRRSGNRHVPAGSAYATTAGQLPARVVIHCVASDLAHRSSDEIIRACVKNALLRANEAGCSSLAIPVFATGHAHFRFERALSVIMEELRASGFPPDHVSVVLEDPDRIPTALRVIEKCFPGSTPDIQISPRTSQEQPSSWFEHE